MNTESIQINDQNFTMHPSGVLFWEEKSMLLISDVHLCKVSHFRKFGAAVPQKAILKNFESMEGALAFFQPKTVVFMGDLFHSSLNSEWELFKKWTEGIRSKLILVIGNHDIISPLKFEDLGIEITQEIRLDDFLLTHHPEKRDGMFNFCGHIHPAIRLTGLGRQSVRLRCFFKSDAQMVLPAFGEFTGSFTVKPDKDSEVYALLGDTVLSVNLKEVKRRKRYFK